MSEVEAVADRVIFIHAGRIVFEGSPQEMKRRAPSLDEAFHQITAAGLGGVPFWRNLCHAS
jgi:ABC-2 type transport system ATP-binding protein